MRKVLTVALSGIWIGFAFPAGADEIDWTKVDAAVGKPGAVLAGGVHRYGLPRTDLHVTLDGVTLKPGFALGSWIAFDPMHDGAMLMGDLVLLDTEVNSVMSKLLESGVAVTALHNHLLRVNPAVFYLHVGGRGDPVKLGAAIHAALAETGTPFGPPAPATAQTPAIDLDTAQLDAIMGAKGHANGGVYQFGIPRRAPVTEGGMDVPPAMGLANGANFQPTGNGKAAITGDFLATADEVTPLITNLRRNGIEVTAIHSHMLDEQPRLLFVHFWANDDAVKLAKGLRAALDQTAAAKM